MQPVNVTDHLSSKPFPIELERVIYQVISGTFIGCHLYSKVAQLAEERFQWIDHYKNVSRFSCGIIGAVSMVEKPVGTLITYFTALVAFWLLSYSALKKESIPSYLLDMTEKARKDNSILDIGECKYFRGMEIVLNRTRKNNIIFVGKAGVGKTTIVESIAKKIAKNQVSPASPFANKKIWSLDLASFMAGTKYIGELETRIIEFLKFAKKHNDDIFFIDEIHTLIGAGRYEGSNKDIAGFLKNALARGEISVIGATTPNENAYLEKDPAFLRRFQRIDIDEPSLKECIQMFRFQKPYFQKHYPMIRLTDRAIDAAVFFAKRDIKDRSGVDAVYDLIDNACSKASLEDLQTITDLNVREIAKMHITFCEAAKKFSVTALVKQFNIVYQRYPGLFPASIPERLAGSAT